jgi:hypothetical protein
VLDRGRLRYLGSPEDLKSRHGAPTLTTAFVAEIAAPRLLDAGAPGSA